MIWADHWPIAWATPSCNDVSRMWLANKFPSVKRLLVQRDNLLSKLDKSAQTPLPPGPLRARVGMTDDEGTFLRIGASIAQDIFWLLDKYGHAIGNSRILDFGCGCGRVARWMPVGLNVTGCDVDREAIGWCQTNLARIGRFVVMEPGPPLPFRAGAFDLVYAISVFTHLTATDELIWLEELARIIRPGGVLLASSVGADFCPHPAELSRIGFALDMLGELEGYPASCCNSYHTRGYIEEKWTKEFEVVGFEPHTINHHQDAVLMRRR